MPVVAAVLENQLEAFIHFTRCRLWWADAGP